MTEFGVEREVAGERAVVVVRGEVDAYTGPALATQLDAALAETPGDVTVDLSAVGFVDSSGIAVLVGAAKKLKERGNELVVQSPAPSVRKLFEMTGVSKFVRVERSH